MKVQKDDIKIWWNCRIMYNFAAELRKNNIVESFN
jgi:hypothetical protein